VRRIHVRVSTYYFFASANVVHRGMLTHLSSPTSTAAVVTVPITQPGDERELSATAAALSFEASSHRDWCELVRDIVAIANSGGGTVKLKTRDATPSMARQGGSIPGRMTIIEKLEYYTGQSFDTLNVATIDGEESAALIHVAPAAAPIGFTQAGLVVDADPTKAASILFPAGSFYFWHGGSSRPGTTDDIREFFHRELRHVARQWVRRMHSMLDETLQPGKAHCAAENGLTNPQPVRIVTDPAAPALQPQDVDRLYPLRQKDLVRTLNRQFGQRLVNSYDIQAVRRQHRLDDRPDFVFYLPGAGRRYSHAAAEWFASEYQRDDQFFQLARVADHEMLMLRRKKPR
jgi:hypothetical protein